MTATLDPGVAAAAPGFLFLACQRQTLAAVTSYVPYPRPSGRPLFVRASRRVRRWGKQQQQRRNRDRRRRHPAADHHRSLRDGAPGGHVRAGDRQSFGAPTGRRSTRNRSSTATRADGGSRPRRCTSGPTNGAASSRSATASKPRSRGDQQPSITSPAPIAEDVGEIAVIQDTGDLILPLNPFDVRSTGLRFTRNGSSYTLSKIDGAFRSVARHPRHARRRRQRARSPFRSRSRSTATAATPRSSTPTATSRSEKKTSRAPSGTSAAWSPDRRASPRSSPISIRRQGSGKIFVNAASDQYTVTWCNVRGFDSTRTATVQATLLPDGSVEMKFADSTNVQESIVGISPGHTAEIALVDLTSGSGSGNGAIAERFAQAELDRHVRGREEVLLDSPRQLRPDPAVDRPAAHPRRVRLRAEHRERGPRHRPGHLRHLEPDRQRRPAAIAGDDGLARQVPRRPDQQVPRREQHAQRLGQEVGHRWLAYVNFRDRTGTSSGALLGRDDAHWSFFFDSDASVMEGNDIEDLGGGQFRTTDAVKRYSRLDQYMMGLDPAGQRADVLLRGEPELDQRPQRRAADRRVVHRHAPRRADRRRHRRQRPAQPRTERHLQGPPPGLHLHRQQRPHPRQRAGRQARQDPHGVGGVLPAGDGEPHDGEYAGLGWVGGGYLSKPRPSQPTSQRLLCAWRRYGPPSCRYFWKPAMARRRSSSPPIHFCICGS